MSKITDQQSNNLHLAIDRAKGQGNCQYVGVYGKKPQCVIAQLAVIEGVSVQAIKSWAGPITVLEREGTDVGPLFYYPLDLLTSLQVMWDSTIIFTSNDECIKQMHTEVDQWQQGVTTGT